MKSEPRFETADFRSSIVKMLANTAVLAALLPRLNEKSARFKIYDRQARRF